MKYAETGLICDSLINEKDNQLQLSEGLIQAIGTELQAKQRQVKWLSYGLGLSGVALILVLLL